MRQTNKARSAASNKSKQRILKIKHFLKLCYESVEAKASIRRVMGKMNVAHAGVLPVFDEGQFVGVITNRGVIIQLLNRWESLSAWGLLMTAREIMDSNPSCINEDLDKAQAEQLMQSKRTDWLVVTNNSNQFSGVLSKKDIEKPFYEKASKHASRGQLSIVQKPKNFKPKDLSMTKER